MADRALNDPAFTPEARSVLGATPGDDWGDAACTELAAVAVVVIAAVGENPVGLAAWSSDSAFDRRGSPCVDERQQLSDVVAVPGADQYLQR